ncbi:TIR domain-containing protein [Amycolatopsis sp. NPDC058278]|uniref:TIR domain-containing protein n=1 Tax=Amycolatopsis sp. NPDC058278 TaxID=3346417 RepID=UPI0036D98FC7
MVDTVPAIVALLRTPVLTGGKMDVLTAGDGQPVAVTVVVLDAVGFSRHGTLVQLRWRDGIREALAAAMRAAGISADQYRAEDRGDGFLVLVSGAVPKPRVVADFVREMTGLLAEHNRTRNAAGRIRLRVSVHHGDVVFDKIGFAGDSVVVASRLIDSPPIRRVFEADDDADLALIVSEEIYGSTVAERFRGLVPETFRHVDVLVPKFTGSAYVHVPGRAAAPAEPGPPAAEAGPPGPGPSTPATGPCPPGESVVAWDFLVSYAPEQERWAEWIAWELTAAGHRVHIEAWDAVAGTHDAQRLHDAVRWSTRTLALLSRDYLRSDEVGTEWQAAWSADRDGMRRKLIPVRIEPCEPDGLLRGIKYIDLAGLPQAHARRKLHAEIQASILGRRPRTPARPLFPG